MYSLTIHPFMTAFMFSDKPSIPVLQHPQLSIPITFAFSDNPSIHDNTCSLSEFIHICSRTTHPFMTPLVLSEFIHICSLTTHPFLTTLAFYDNPSIPDNTCSLRIHPHLFPDYPSIPDNTCILWQSIHSWLNISIVWQSIHSWQQSYYLNLTLHPL